MKENAINQKRVVLEMLADVFDKLDNLEQYHLCNYEQVGQHQETKWDSELRQRVLCWEDDEKTVPVMVDDYGYVPIPESDYDEDQRMHKAALELIRKTLTKLI